MENKITFLGTGGDAFVIGKQIRASGGIILQAEGLQFHIDPGPGALVKAAENGIQGKRFACSWIGILRVHADDGMGGLLVPSFHGGDANGYDDGKGNGPCPARQDHGFRL